MNKKLLVTHNGQGHMDDYFAVAAFLLANSDYEVIRTRDKNIFDNADALIDVGNDYNPEKDHFDHHQKGGAGERSNSIPYASAGLVWKKYGAILCDNDQGMADSIEQRLISFIDSLDTNTDVYEMKIQDTRVYSIRDYFYCLFQPFQAERDNMQEHDRLFFLAVAKAKELLQLEIAKAKENKELIQYVEDRYEQASEKRIIVFSKSCPFQFVLQKYKEPLFVIIPYQQSQFVVIAVKEQDSSVDRLPFPVEWRAKNGNELQEAAGITDLHFCHGQGYMLIANTFDSAKAAAEKAIQIS